jgi:uncharacterized Zn finger protein
MDNVSCPECSSPAVRMPVLSYVSRSDNYYCCLSCGQVSHMPKDASSGPVIIQPGQPVRPTQHPIQY